MTLPSYDEQFGLGSRLRFETHASGLVQGLIATDECRGSFFLHGAHVSGFQPKTTKWPVLFMSRESVFQSHHAIRGGVPICFPWFGPHPSDPSKPAHGLVRQTEWQLRSTCMHGEAVQVDLGLTVGPFEVLYRVAFGSELHLTLQIQNISDDEMPCEMALHTYFQIGDIHKAAIRGLEHVPFIDQLTGRRVPASGTSIEFDSETDRIYQGHAESILLEDQKYGREIRLSPKNSESTIVWNPWIEKSARMVDFGDDEYPSMCCIETANVRDNRISLKPLEAFEIGVGISVQDR